MTTNIKQHTVARRWWVASAIATISLSGCEGFLDVVNPGPLSDAELNVPAAVQGVVTGMSADFSVMFDYIVPVSGIAADEINHGGSYTNEGLWVRGIFRPEDVNTQWANMQRARWVAEQGIVRMKGVAGYTFDSNVLSARAYLWAGLANRTLGEVACQAVIDNGPAEPVSVHFTRAEGHFTEAIRIGTAVGGAAGTAVVNAAYGGRAAARAALGKWAEAVTDAQRVPTNFVWNATYSTNSSRENNEFVSETWVRREFSVWGTRWATVFGDPRVPWDTVKTTSGAVQKGQDGKTNYFRQRKFTDLGAEIPLVKGTEMLMIRAEERLRASDIAGAYGHMNAARAFYGMAPLTAATSLVDAWKVFKAERGATLWLEGRRWFDLRRWAAESGPMNDTFLTGRATCLPISQNERDANPNLRP
ncbi:MAG: RagB/SusD family nutrient uptake outer membrane protein [Gemmatimonadaceae bacterium]